MVVLSVIQQFFQEWVQKTFTRSKEIQIFLHILKTVEIQTPSNAKNYENVYRENVIEHVLTLTDFPDVSCNCIKEGF